MRVIQHYTGSKLRNFTYFIVGNQGHAFIVDPWDGEESLEKVKQESALVKGVINTHEHWDHTRGNEVIVKKTDCPVYAHPRAKGKVKEADVFMNDGEKIVIDNETELMAIDTPGHTFAHLCLILFHQGRIEGVFTGDTLFNAGVGNCHNGGDPETLFQTIEEKFQTLDDHVRVYPGHEYLGNNLGFTLKYEPGNEEAKSWQKKYESIDWENSPQTTTIAEEKKINLFLRLESNGIQLPIGHEATQVSRDRKNTFLTLRELRNHW